MPISPTRPSKKPRRQLIWRAEQRHFIKQGQHVDTFLNALDEIIADSPDDDQFIKQLARNYNQRT
jgi:hypothetical protein